MSDPTHACALQTEFNVWKNGTKKGLPTKRWTMACSFVHTCQCQRFLLILLHPRPPPGLLKAKELFQRRRSAQYAAQLQALHAACGGRVGIGVMRLQVHAAYAFRFSGGGFLLC